MAAFITLTDVAGLPELVNADHITRAWARGEGGSRVSFLDGEDTVAYRETPEQIDALLGVTEPVDVSVYRAALEQIAQSPKHLPDEEDAEGWATLASDRREIACTALRAARGE